MTADIKFRKAKFKVSKKQNRKILEIIGIHENAIKNEIFMYDIIVVPQC